MREEIRTYGAVFFSGQERICSSAWCISGGWKLEAGVKEATAALQETRTRSKFFFDRAKANSAFSHHRIQSDYFRFLSRSGFDVLSKWTACWSPTLCSERRNATLSFLSYFSEEERREIAELPNVVRTTVFPAGTGCCENKQFEGKGRMRIPLEKLKTVAVPCHFSSGKAYDTTAKG